jgi:hypothetical protein
MRMSHTGCACPRDGRLRPSRLGADRDQPRRRSSSTGPDAGRSAAISAPTTSRNASQELSFDMALTAAAASAARPRTRQAAWRYASTCSPGRPAARTAMRRQARLWGRTGTRTQRDSDALGRTQTLPDATLRRQTQLDATLRTQTQLDAHATDATRTQRQHRALRQRHCHAAHTRHALQTGYRRELAWRENVWRGRAMRSRNRELWKTSTRPSTRLAAPLKHGLPSNSLVFALRSCLAPN